MNPCDCLSSILADWFAAIGTIGAVAFALYQNSQTNKPKLNIRLTSQTYWTRSRIKSGSQNVITKYEPTDDPEYTKNCHKSIVMNIYNASGIGIGVTEKGFHLNGVSYPSQSKFKNTTWIHPFRKEEFSIDAEEVEHELAVFKKHNHIKIKFYITTIDGQVKFSRNYSYVFGHHNC